MSVRRPVSGAAEDVIPFAARAASSLAHGRMLLIGAVGAVIAILAIPLICGADAPWAAANSALQCYDSAGNYVSCRADMPSVAANSALQCYDSAGNYQPCVSATRASGLPSRFFGQAVADHQPTNLTVAASDQPTSPAVTANDQPTSSAATANDQPTSLTATASYQPASWATSAPVARRGSTPPKRPVSTICGRHFLPCFFSTLRRGVTHMASVAAMHGARSARARYPNNF